MDCIVPWGHRESDTIKATFTSIPFDTRESFPVCQMSPEGGKKVMPKHKGMQLSRH